MRINQYVARATGLSRRAADDAVSAGRVLINSQPATLGQAVSDSDEVTLDGQALSIGLPTLIMLNKPRGYVSSRAGQGSRTIYELLPPEYRALKPVGRLDKYSEGLLLLTNDGVLANRLTHPRYAKTKVYEVELNRLLAPDDAAAIEAGVELDDGPSQLELKPQGSGWQVTMSEGRNRQIRRTFAALGYEVTSLKRLRFGEYSLDNLPTGDYRTVSVILAL